VKIALCEQRKVFLIGLTSESEREVFADGGELEIHKISAIP